MPTLLGQVNEIVKRKYPSYAIEQLAYKDRPILAMIEKDTSFDGDTFSEVLRFTRGAGGSRVYGNARANHRPDRYGRFLLTRKRNYGMNAVETEAMLAAASRGDGALVNIVSETMDSCLETISRNMNIDLYGNGGGALGAIGAITGGRLSFTLAAIPDAVHFELDQDIDFSVDDGAAAAPAGLRAGGPYLITAINRQTGLITITPALNAAVAVADFAFRDGDYDATGPGKISGFAGYIPAVAPGAALFNGLNRSVDTDRLGGIRFNGVPFGLDEACVRGMAEIARLGGGKPDVLVMNTETLGDFVNLMQGRARIVDEEIANVGFRRLEVSTPFGVAKVYGDRDCPTNRAYFLQMDTWHLRSLGPCPTIYKEDGLTGIRMSASNLDAYEFYAYAFVELGCKAPGHNGVILLP